MTPPLLPDRRRFLGTALCGAVAACGGGGGGTVLVTPTDGSGGATAGDAVSDGRIASALDQIDGLANALMARSGLPGMAVAVVRGEQTVYAKGFGVRVAGGAAAVDADTVFQLASVSKPIGATVVARQVGLGGVGWDTRVRALLPWFALSDAAVTDRLTVADLYAHRSGLPDHAGDRLEDLGYDRRQVLERLRYLPLQPFGTYEYTNYGLTAAAEGVAAAAGLDWATLSEQAIYLPLGMDSTSSRFADFERRPNRAVGHVQVDGRYVPGPVRMPDPQSPAGGVSSSVNDMTRWLALLLGRGTVAGRRIVDAGALAPALSPQIKNSPNGYYGYGFNVGTTAAGRVNYNHSGGFGLGAATHFRIVPATGLGMVALSNGYPVGLPETLVAQFFDLVEFGAIQRDWAALFAQGFAPFNLPEGSLVGVPPPAKPQPPKALDSYTGSYRNDYHGPAQVSLRQGSLVLSLGPAATERALAHWDGDVFTFTLRNENAAPGTISKASFVADRVTLEYYDQERLGTFVR